MVDRERLLAKVAELEGYLTELRSIAPRNFESFHSVEKKRACERLLQVSVEAVIDLCHLLVVGYRLGLPSEEEDIISKLEKTGLLSARIRGTIRAMKGLRNVLVHEYAAIDDRIVFDVVRRRLGDFDRVKKEILKAVKKQSS